MSVRLSASMYPAYRNPIQFIIYFANIFPFLWPGLLPLLLYAWCTRGALVVLSGALRKTVCMLNGSESERLFP